MTRRCDNPTCKKLIPLGVNFIEVKFIGMKAIERIIGDSVLHFCSLECFDTYSLPKSSKFAEVLKE